MKILKTLLCDHQYTLIASCNGESKTKHIDAVCDKCNKTLSIKTEVVYFPTATVKFNKCKKRAYKTKKDALMMLNNYNKSKHQKRKHKRAYHCPKCKSWHLTSVK